MDMVQGFLRAGVCGSGMIAAVLVCRALLAKRLPGRVFPLLWGLAAVRLLVPLALASPLSLYALAPRAVAGPVTAGAAAPAVQTAGGFPWAAVWGAGTVGTALVFGLRYWRGRRLFAQSLPAEDGRILEWIEEHPLRRRVQARVSDQTDTPLTYGVLRPVILLPGWMTWEDGMDYALLHEYIHIRWMDAGLRLLTALALCVHWWNPLVWAMYLLSETDVELACDREVVRRCGAEHRGGYARALLNLEEKRRALGMGMNYRGGRKRIGAILAYRKSGAAAGAAGVLLVAALALTLGASPFRSPLDKLEASIACRDGQVSFTVPEGDGAWEIFVSGRIYAGGMGMSAHYLEGAAWEPGQAYAFPLEGPYSDLTLAAYRDGQERVIDLLPRLPGEYRAG